MSTPRHFIGGESMIGKVTLTAAEVDALKVGNLYISLLTAETPLNSARADLEWPAA